MPDSKQDIVTIRDVQIRNLRRVESKGHGEHGSFLFEAMRNGKWIAFGPECFGNWSVASHITRDPCFPTSNLFDDGWEDPDTVPIGWWSLNEACKSADLSQVVDP